MLTPAQLGKNAKSPLPKADLPPVPRERQLLAAIGWRRLPGIVVLPPQVTGSDLVAPPISQAAPEAC
jgi:hypothetical protein